MGRRYWCVSVGFVYRSTDIVSPTRLDLVSRNTCCSVEISAVNFMLGWKLLASTMLGPVQFVLMSLLVC